MKFDDLGPVRRLVKVTFDRIENVLLQLTDTCPFLKGLPVPHAFMTSINQSKNIIEQGRKNIRIVRRLVKNKNLCVLLQTLICFGFDMHNELFPCFYELILLIDDGPAFERIGYRDFFSSDIQYRYRM